MYPRLLSKKIPQRVSFFLFGPRQTGKTTILSSQQSILTLDFLNTEVFLKYSAAPDLLYEEIEQLSKTHHGAHMIWLDEVQKVPQILETVHRVLNNFPNFYFALSGSSARKLKRGAANLLGGRAIDLKLHPLTEEEMGEDFNLENAMAFGSLPKIVQLLAFNEQTTAIALLQSYVSTYLKEEIHAEALVQNLQLFQGFIEIAVEYIGKQINFSEVASRASISQHFVKKYFTILEDTLIGYFLQPYGGSTSKQLTKQPKFYLFDNGVSRSIQRVLSKSMSPVERGVLYEQWVVGEVHRHLSYENSEIKTYFWRTRKGAEVDILVCHGSDILLAIECKSNPQITKSDFSGLAAFHKSHPKVPLVLCAPVERARTTERGVEILPPSGLIKKLKDVLT